LTQLDLLSWGLPPAPPPPPVWRGAARYGFTISRPCICGRTHNGVFLDYPWSMPSLRHWRVTEPSPHTAAMMAERYAQQVPR
jgi:hypothetical protein